MMPLLDPAERHPIHGTTTRVVGTWYDADDGEHPITADLEIDRGRYHWSDIQIDGEPVRWRDVTASQEMALLRALDESIDEAAGRDDDYEADLERD